MADHAEEQEMEAEAMAAIFDSHFEVLGAGQWNVTIYPESGADLSELNAVNHVGCKLLVTLPPTYPDLALPELDIEIVKGLAEEQRQDLKALAEEEAAANSGAPSLFAVTERLREWLLENNVKGLDDVSMHAQMMRKKQQEEKAQHKAQSAFEAQKKTDIMSEAEKEELEVTKRRAEGTPCNKENFEAWQSRFLRERAADKAREEEGEGDGKSGGKKKDKVKDVDKSGRLTGFEHFNSKMDNLEALEAAAEAAEQGFEDVDEELFDDDVDLDDLDFDDEDDDEEEDEDVDI